MSSCPLLLLLDGHSSHFEPETIRIAKEENIIIFCLPPHTTHELQPLDCTLFGPLKTAWADVCHSFFKQYPGQVVSKLNFCQLFHSAWLKAVTPQNISVGFKKAGIWPFNPEAVKQSGKGCAEGGEEGDDGGEEGGEGGDGREVGGDSGEEGSHGEEGGGGGEVGGDDSNNVSGSSGNGHGDDTGDEDGGCASRDGRCGSEDDGEDEREGDEDGGGDMKDTSGEHELTHLRASQFIAREATNRTVAADNMMYAKRTQNVSGTFTPEQEERFQRRVEEGYDIYDPIYITWLELNHPENLPPDRYKLMPYTGPSLPSPTACLSSAGDTGCPSNHPESTPSSSKTPDASLHSHSSSSKTSPLSNYLSPMTPTAPRIKTGKDSVNQFRVPCIPGREGA